MAKENKHVLVVYFSPAGSTRHVAQVMEKKFDALGTEVSAYNLCEQKDVTQKINRQIQRLKKNCCLVIGSPVYVSRALPPVMQFISDLVENTGALAVPFVTWGGASSGIALYEMGRKLSRKGFMVINAAKVLAVHSLMWPLESPVGKGHPDSQDDRMVEQLASEINTKLHSKDVKEIELSALAYQTKEAHAEMEKSSLEVAKGHMPPRKVEEALCNQCEVCVEVCPTNAVDLSPYPSFGENCIFCFNCMKHCPERAIIADLSEIWQRIKDRVEFFSERPFTEIF